MGTEFDRSCREEARRQWNRTACGELSGDKNSREYFDKVAKNRYSQQDWVKDYFTFCDFSKKRVLEIGVGQGTDLMEFAKGGARCFGIDITENHLDLTSANFSLHGEKVDLRKADATELPFSNDFFDCVYSFGVLHHIREDEKVVDEILRVLKPGGKAMIALYYKWSAFHVFRKVFADGIRNGRIFTKGYRGLLATIETGADGVAVKPFVKLYSKADARSLFNKFEIEDLSVHQLKPDHFWPRILARWMSPVINKLEATMGWYVTCKATKR